MRVVSRWAVVVVLVWAAGCSDSLAPERSQLETNRDRWAAQGMSRYEFTLTQVCFCAIDGPRRVSVLNGAVVSVTKISNGQPLDTRFVPTVDSLFAFIERGLAEHAAILDVTYDPQLGYPRKIVYDGKFTIADDEVTFEVSNVLRVAPAAGAAKD